MQAWSETRWGDQLSVNIGAAGGLVLGSKRVIQVDERFSRSWTLRLYLACSRALVVGENINCRFDLVEGVGSAAAQWSQTLTLVAPNQFDGPTSFDLAFSHLNVDAVYLNSSLLSAGTVTAHAWVAPVVPVVPLGNRHV